MYKDARHALDRLRERTSLHDKTVPTLDALVEGVRVPAGRYHLPLHDHAGATAGWAAYKTVGPDGQLVLATILGPDMLPRGSADIRPYLSKKHGEKTMKFSAMQKLAARLKRAEEHPDKNKDGEISPEELHEHFDADHDGKVDMLDYARHINLHMAHPEWLAQDTAELVAKEEGVPVKKTAAFAALRRRLQSQSR